MRVNLLLEELRTLETVSTPPSGSDQSHGDVVLRNDAVRYLDDKKCWMESFYCVGKFCQNPCSSTLAYRPMHTIKNFLTGKECISDVLLISFSL